MTKLLRMWLVGGVCLVLGCAIALAQATTSVLSGTVLDPGKASIPAASVEVVNANTGTTVTASTDAKGYWAIPDLQAGNYKVTVTHTGFKAGIVSNVKIDAGIPATVNVTLQVGEQSQTVEVSSGAEVLQSQTATVSNNIQGSQIRELPFTSRNVTELVATQAGTESAGGIRYSLIDGLPQSTINQTLDGINIQDNGAKSGDGIFVAVQPRTDAVQEVTVSSAASGADSLGEGAVQMKFVTKSGTNQWHGDLFEQNRNQILEANYFFNAAAGLPRDKLNLNDFGGSIGGPVIKDKVFFFFAMDAFRLPQSILETGQTWLTPTAASGVFTYKESSGTVNTVNLYNLAANENPNLPATVRPFPTTPDPKLAAMETEIQNLIDTSGLPQVSRVSSNNDYNRFNFSSSPSGFNNRNFPTARLDWDLNSKNRVSFIANYQTNNRLPDAVNLTENILPGTGSLLGSPVTSGQYDDFFTYVGSVRTILSSNITNEVSFGEVGGADWFDGPMSGVLAPYDQYWYGTVASFNSYITNPYRVTLQSVSKRDDPVTQFSDSLSWLKGNHLMNFGFDFSSISENSWNNGSQTIPSVTLSNLSTDPDNSGSTNLFTTTTLPGASSQQLSDAAALYAVLTGRVSAISTQATLNPSTGQYGNGPTINSIRQREWAIYAQDSWKATANLTLNYGLRFDKQQPFQDVDGLWTNPGIAGMYGISGVGNLFQPGASGGAVPVFDQEPKGAFTYAHSYKFDPSFGFAYQLPFQRGWLNTVLGNNAVVRGGYAIATIREGTSDVLASNPGRTISTAVSPTTTPSVFSAGQVQLADFGGGTGFNVPTLAPTTLDPSYPTPSYPIPVQTSNSLNAYDPNLKMEYVQSWDFGLQREFGPNTAVEVRYVGNHGTDLFRVLNLNEVNIFENGFLSQFEQAQQNLAINRQSTPTSNNFGDLGAAGEAAVPILTTALGTSNNQTTATQLVDGAAGAAATGIATNTKEMAALVAAGYAPNLFVVNPATTSSVNLTTNGGSSTYNSLQIEVRRRLSHGLTLQGSYVYAHGLTNTGNGVLTLRDSLLDKGESPEDMRHAFKVNWIYALPIGPSHALFANVNNPVGRFFTSGWSYAGVARVQSGVPSELMSGTAFATFDNNDPGVVLHNITASQLQQDMKVNITGADPSTVVYYLPQSLINNTLAAYRIGSNTLNPTAPYISAPLAGQLGQRVYLYGPWFSKFDMSLVKNAQITERWALELRLQALNVFNAINFELPGAGNSASQQTIQASATNFGQTTNSFRDFQNTNDPGSRTLEFYITLTF